MAESKDELVRLLKLTATLMELRGDNPFRCRAYENGARALEALDGTPEEWLDEGRLENVKGVGKSLIEAVEQWVASGTIERCEELHAEIPEGLVDLIQIPGFGAKKARQVYDELGIDSLEKLEEAAREGERLADLPGFGKKTVEKILEGIEQRRKFSERRRIDVARAAGDRMLEHLKKVKAVQRIELGGSIRRCRETIKDLDIVVASDAPEKVMEAFVNAPGVIRVVGRGETKSSIVLEEGVPADLRVVGKKQFPAALNYFTGNKQHNTRLRGIAKDKGLRLNEYGLFEIDGGKEKALPLKEEADIYRRLGLAYVEPELREDMGEIEAAAEDKLPTLVSLDDMRGMLHCHSDYSDGKSTIEQMARAAKEAGYAYFGLCDHSKSAAYAGGLKEDDVKRQHEEIDKLNAKFKDGFCILKGIESDILAGGELDYDDDFLERFDFVVVSIHSRFGLKREEMTRRVCRALEHPAATIFAHPTGRLLQQREPYAIDLEAAIETAAERDAAIEINANPRRLDLDWREIPRAKKAGCRFAVNPDAHHVSGLDDMVYGIGIARKGWLEKGDVVNSMTLRQFRSWLKKRGQPGAK